MRYVPAALIATLVAALATPAGAVGTGGVEFSPDQAQAKGGKAVTAFHVGLPRGGQSEQHYRLRNLTGHPVTVRLYAASVEASGTGAYAVAGPGSAPWIQVRDSEVTLPPHAERSGTFVVSTVAAPAGHGTTYGAVVLERASASVVTRVATLVYLQQGGTRGPVRNPLLLGLAAALAALVGSSVLLTSRRRASLVNESHL